MHGERGVCPGHWGPALPGLLRRDSADGTLEVDMRKLLLLLNLILLAAEPSLYSQTPTPAVPGVAFANNFLGASTDSSAQAACASLGAAGGLVIIPNTLAANYANPSYPYAITPPASNCQYLDLRGTSSSPTFQLDSNPSVAGQPGIAVMVLGQPIGHMSNDGTDTAAGYFLIDDGNRRNRIWGLNPLVLVTRAGTSAWGIEPDVSCNAPCTALGADTVSGGSYSPTWAYRVNVAPGMAPWIYGLAFVNSSVLTAIDASTSVVKNDLFVTASLKAYAAAGRGQTAPFSALDNLGTKRPYDYFNTANNQRVFQDLGGGWALNDINGNTKLTLTTGVGNPVLQLQGQSQSTSFASAVNAVSFSTRPTFDLQLGNVQQFSCTTPGAAISPTVTNPTKGMMVTVIFIQNGTTPCALTWPANVHGGITVSAKLSSVNVQTFIVSNGGTDLFATGPGSTGITGGTP